MANNTIRLEIITPTKMFYRDDVELLVVKTTKGEEGFMAGHMWARKLLAIGPLKIREPGASEMRYGVIAGGYIDVSSTVIMIYTDAAEWDTDIDLKLATDQKAAAEKYLKEHKDLPDDDPNIIAVQKGLARSEARIHAAKRRDGLLKMR